MARLALNLDNSRAKSDKIGIGGMGEWLKPAVLKTVSGVTRSGVRIPLPPPVYLIRALRRNLWKPAF